MPYISADARIAITVGEDPKTAGELNFAISVLIDNFLSNFGVSYARLNECIGVLECAKLELYRRIAAPYEDKKIVENGEVYLSKEQV